MIAPPPHPNNNNNKNNKKTNGSIEVAEQLRWLSHHINVPQSPRVTMAKASKIIPSKAITNNVEQNLFFSFKNQEAKCLYNVS